MAIKLTKGNEIYKTYCGFCILSFIEQSGVLKQNETIQDSKYMSILDC